MVAHVQGGIGEGHVMTRESLALDGIPYENGSIFAFVAHTIMTLLVINLGLISVVAMPFFNSQKRAQDPGNK